LSDIELAVIGGSGLYGMAELTGVEEISLNTPFGKPSDNIIVGKLHGRRVAFLPRHGRGHVLNPTEVPYRANIFALKLLGVKYVVAVSACGSLREDYAPGCIVVPDQLFDHTKKREMTFFENGLVAHVGVPNAFSPEFSRVVADAAKASGGMVHESGTFITIEGPRFSTKGESNLYRQWGMSLVGMTTSPEAFLAAEAEMAYTVMAHVTDYDVWHETEQPVTVDQVLTIIQGNTALAQKAISRIAQTMDEWAGDFAAHHGLKDAVLTDRAKISASAIETLRPLIGKYLE